MLLVLFALVASTLKGQSYKDIVDNTHSGIDITKQLPPLSTLQSEAEIYSPLIKMQDAEVKIKQLQIRSLKKDWMSNIGFDAGVKYGMFDNLILSQDLGIEDLQTSSTEQTRYSVGVSLKMPLKTFLDKTDVQIAKIELESLMYKRETLLSELRKLVVIQYNDVVRAYRNILVQNSSVEMYRVQMIQNERDFNDGIIGIAEYARVNNILAGSIMRLEELKLEYSTAILVLEETVGVKLELKK